MKAFLHTRWLWLAGICWFLCGYAADDPASLPVNCKIDCVADFGLVLGTSPSGVTAYSNCSSACVFPQPFYLDGVYTGIQWQCVEYARRWLLDQQGVVFGDVDIAAHIWKLEHLSDPGSKQNFEFLSVENGSSDASIIKGDLLIYDETYLGTGHVAVVTEIDKTRGWIEVGEQNYHNALWQGNYARRIPFALDEGGLWVLDAYLIGWKRVAK